MSMRLSRAPFAALLPLFLALGAAAGVVRVPPAASPAPAIAGYQAGLVSLDPTSARSFLADGAARDLLRASQPDMYASSLLRAHEIAALAAVPARHREAFLRRELIAVESLPLLQGDADLPARHRAQYGSRADARRIARASCAWDTLAPELRTGLAAQEIDAASWSAAPVSMRASIIAGWWHTRLVEDSGAEAGSPGHLAALRLYARRAGGYLTDRQATELDDRISSLERLAGILPEARESEGFVHDARDKAQREALVALGRRLSGVFRRLAAGTSAEALLAKAEGRVQVGGVPSGSDGAYQAYGDRLALPADVIGYLLRDRGARFEDLASDDALLERLAVMYLPTYVHETTHRMQSRDALKRSLTAFEKGMLYGHEDEHEAYLAQELFVREFALIRPELAAWARAVPRVAGVWDPAVVARQGKRVSRLYSDVPGGAGRRAQGLLMAITEANQALRLKPRIERELARRRSSPGERHDPVRTTPLAASSIRGAASRLLLRWRDMAGTSAALFADEILSYLDAGDARVAALKKSLRPLRPNGATKAPRH